MPTAKKPTRTAKTPKLRLQRVVVQPVFVLDDGKTLKDVVYGLDEQGQPITNHPPILVPAANWPTYSSEQFPEEMKAFQARIDAELKQA